MVVTILHFWCNTHRLLMFQKICNFAKKEKNKCHFEFVSNAKLKSSEYFLINPYYYMVILLLRIYLTYLQTFRPMKKNISIFLYSRIHYYIIAFITAFSKFVIKICCLLIQLSFFTVKLKSDKRRLRWKVWYKSG